MLKKRGLSGVVVTLLMIVLSITAVVIVWAVIKNVVESGSEDIGLDTYTINLEIQKVSQSTNSADITVKRNPGQGALVGLSFVISDGINKQTFEQNNVNLSELETKTFTISYNSLIKKIEIAPIVSINGKNLLQNPVENFDIPAKDSVKNMPGLVSWYRFEGNANDEMGLNNGVLVQGSVLLLYPELTAGKFGQAYKFENQEADQIISVNHHPSLQLENSNMTIIAWINKSETGGTENLLTKGDVINNGEQGYYILIYPSGSIQKTLFGTDNFAESNGGNLTRNKWTHIAASQNIKSGTHTLTVYLNGSLSKQSSAAFSATSSGTEPLEIGGSSNGFSASFEGTIDEVMIFNKSLSGQEVQALYNLDLS
jgi:pterin-4a-carbinolamine dehydratase